MFYTSATDLNNFFSCPARYEFSKRMRPKKVAQALLDGTAAHAMLAGEQPHPITPRAVSFARRLGRMYELNYRTAWADENFKPVVELWQRIAPLKGVRLTRVIDAFGITEDGETVLIDYKTGTYPYKSDQDIVPQVMGFQAAAYLMPPEEFPFEEWPARIDFLHAPEKGADKIHTYRHNPEDEQNLLEAIKMMKSAKSYPKVRGYQCNTCPFFDACFETEGWEDKYEERKKK